MEDLYIKVLPEGNQEFNVKDYVLTLENSQSFKATIEGYPEIKAEEAKIQENYQKDKIKYKNLANSRIQDEGWSLKKGQRNYDANIKNAKEKRDQSLEKLNIDRYNNIKFIWALRRKIKNDITKWTIGDSTAIEKSFSFPKVLEGGGYAWLEPCLSGASPTGNQPQGCYVRAIGIPKILSAKWFKDEKGKNSISQGEIMQTVWLHIETEGLYGQEIGISLLDSDVLSSNDELSASIKHKQFDAEVNAYAKSDNTEKITNSTYIQKVVRKIIIDAYWIKEGGENLKIYPKVISKQDNFETFSGEAIEVDGSKFLIPDKPTSNIPSVVDQVDTDVASFHPCRYEKVIVKFDEDGDQKELTLFDAKEGEQSDQLIYPFVAGNDQSRKSFE